MLKEYFLSKKHKRSITKYLIHIYFLQFHSLNKFIVLCNSIICLSFQYLITRKFDIIVLRTVSLKNKHTT